MVPDGDGRAEGRGVGLLPGGAGAFSVSPPLRTAGAAGSSDLCLTCPDAPQPSAQVRPGGHGAARALAACGLPSPTVSQIWPSVGGRNRFYCGGRCITGPSIDNWYNCCAWTSICIPTACYFVFCARYLWLHVTKWMPVLAALSFVSTVVFLLLTSCTDPGIIPRHSLQVAVDGLEEEVARVTGVSPAPIDAQTMEPVCTLTTEQNEMGYRWCTTCQVARPPRASHCRDCDNCVLTFDHHCPFVNNCVGQRNYPFFCGFLVSLGCLGVAIIGGFVVRYSNDSSDTSPLDYHNPMLYLLLLVGVPTAVLLTGVLCLMLFHLWLTCSGKTTKEALTGRTNAVRRTLFWFRGPPLVRGWARVSPHLPSMA